jgi:hypothetical protein
VDHGRDAVRKRRVKRLYRVVHTLEDGRRLYLSTGGKLMVMPQVEADFWVRVARQVHTITIDEMVYSEDLRYYDRRSYFLEELKPFVRVARTMAERTDVALDPDAFIIGGIRATEVEHEFRPQHDYSNTIVIIV